MPVFDKEIPLIIDVLQKGEPLLYPTDTVWGLGCDATNKKAVYKIFEIKGRNPKQKFILLAEDIEMIKNYVENDLSDIDLFLKKCSNPCTIIYPQAKNLPNNVISEDGSIAFRIPQDEFCQSLLAKFGKPIVSTSANFHGKSTPKIFAQIDKEIVKLVKYTVKFKQDATKKASPSSIYRWYEKEQTLIKLR